MGGRYYITGAQLGMLKAFVKLIEESKYIPEEVWDLTLNLKRILNEIEANQYICDADTFEKLNKLLSKETVS